MVMRMAVIVRVSQRRGAAEGVAVCNLLTGSLWSPPDEQPCANNEYRQISSYRFDVFRVYPSICLPVCLSVLGIYLSYLSVSLFFCVSIFPFICLSLGSIFHISLCLSIYCIYLWYPSFVCQSIYWSVFPICLWRLYFPFPFHLSDAFIQSDLQ